MARVLPAMICPIAVSRSARHLECRAQNRCRSRAARRQERPCNLPERSRSLLRSRSHRRPPTRSDRSPKIHWRISPRHPACWLMQRRSAVKPAQTVLNSINVFHPAGDWIENDAGSHCIATLRCSGRMKQRALWLASSRGSMIDKRPVWRRIRPTRRAATKSRKAR